MLRFTTRAIDLKLEDAIRQARGPWRLHAGQDVILQEGSVARIEASGPDRCHTLRQQVKAFEPGDAVWMGGLSFDPDHEPTGVWSGFPSASFHLPKRQVRWQDGTAFETTCDGPELPLQAAANGQLKCSTQDEWHRDVKHVEQAISDETVSKTVLARCEATPTLDAKSDLVRLMASEPGLTFAFAHDGSTFYGVSPERLVHLDSQQITTHALAGSSQAGQQAGEALLGSGKDAVEHEFVAEFVRKQLLAAGATGVQEAPRRLRSLRHVQHLETPIVGQASPDTHVLDLVDVLHPTPAVCGTPRTSSMQLIRDIEGSWRGWYAGAVGWFDAQGQGEFTVALRCALQVPDRRYVFAGAGIVAGSEAGQEWQETEWKMMGLRHVPAERP